MVASLAGLPSVGDNIALTWQQSTGHCARNRSKNKVAIVRLGEEKPGTAAELANRVFGKIKGKSQVTYLLREGRIGCEIEKKRNRKKRDFSPCYLA